MPKATPSRAAAAARRHNPLADDIQSAGHLRTEPSKKGKRKSHDHGDEERGGERYVDAKLSRKILQIGQELADEDEAERATARAASNATVNAAFDFNSRFDDEEPFSDDDGKFGEDEWADEEEEIEEVVRCSRLLSTKRSGNCVADGSEK